MNPILRHTLHPSEMLPESLKRMPPTTELAEDSSRWKRNAGQSEARKYTPLAKLDKDVYNSGLTWKLHHLPPKKKSLYNPPMGWIELRGQKGTLLWGQIGCNHLDFLSYAGHQQNGRHRSSVSVFLVELETDKGGRLRSGRIAKY